MNYFLITTMCRDGEHEYYDKISLNTKMSEQDMKANKDFWKECILAWDFHWIKQDSNGEWWADLRIVRIDSWRSISVKDYEILDYHIGGWNLEDIILHAQGDFEPNEENVSKYVGAA